MKRTLCLFLIPFSFLLVFFSAHNYSQREINRQRATIRKSKFIVSRKIRTTQPVLTQSMCDDIMSRPCFIRVPRLTTEEISHWTKSSHRCHFVLNLISNILQAAFLLISSRQRHLKNLAKLQLKKSCS